MTYIVAVYSKFKTKKAIKEKLKTSPSFKKNPAIDLLHPRSGRYGTPEEIRKGHGKETFAVTNPKRSWFGTFKYIKCRKKTNKCGYWRFT